MANIPIWAISAVGLAIASERLMAEGYVVAVPLCDIGYDLVAMCGAKCWRLQVKTSRGSGSAHSRRRICIRKGSRHHLRYTRSECDALLLVNYRTKQIMVLPVEEAAARRHAYWSHADRFLDVARLKTVRTGGVM